jgi:hypothetical protein
VSNALPSIKWILFSWAKVIASAVKLELIDLGVLRKSEGGARRTSYELNV